ncbi:MAG: hypothetical protein JXL80_15480 [Planctomycetes bacterium]|nr:hypothetical protein [Planctomycetota bacterium]
MPTGKHTQGASPRKERWWWIGDWWPYGRSLVVAFWRRGQLWPWLLALAPVAVVLVARHFGWHRLGGPPSKNTYEAMAVPLTAAATFAWLLRAAVSRSRMALVIAVQAAVFCCREIHFTGTHHGVFVATGFVAAWALVWAWVRRDLLLPETEDWRQISWLVATAAAYAVAMIIQRRAFKWIPGEQAVHVPLEEAAETMAHMMLLAAALIGTWRRDRTQIVA